jgi:hypothetical protein
LNEILIGYDKDQDFNDINISPKVIENFVNIKYFYCPFEEIPKVDGMKGFLHIKELRRSGYYYCYKNGENNSCLLFLVLLL